MRSGNPSLTSSRVRNVSSFASGSPGPAMPTTRSSGRRSLTRRTLSTACSGVSTLLVTPGRDSLLQSYLRLQ